jgi:DNA-binding CsgD family transcriptional regulator
MTTKASSLTKREIEVLNLVRQGMTNKEVACLLSIKPVTVEFHLGNIYRKLGALTRMSAVLLAEKKGIFEAMEIHR